MHAEHTCAFDYKGCATSKDGKGCEKPCTNEIMPGNESSLGGVCFLLWELQPLEVC